MEKSNLEKLKSLGRIGGKGSVRRKKLNSRNKIKPTLIKTQNDLNLENILLRVNNKISIIDTEEDYESFFVYVNDIICEHLKGLSKFDFKNKDDFKKFRDDPDEYFSNIFINNDGRISFIKDISTYKKIFMNESIKYFTDMFRCIENILENKKYLEDKINNNEDDELNLRECYELFDLDYTSEITKEELHKKYKEKSLLYHPDRNIKERKFYEEKFKNLNMSYKFIIKNM